MSRAIPDALHLLTVLPTPAFVWRRDEAGALRLVGVNGAAETLTRGRIAPLLGVELREFFGSDVALADAIQQTLDDGVTRTLDHEYLMRSTGERLWLDMATVRADDAAVVIARDVTAEHAAAALLKESEARFRGAFEQSATGMSLTSFEGRWLRVNAALCTMLDRTEEELLATTFMALTHPDDVVENVRLRDALAAGRIPRYRMEKRFVRPDGSVVWVDLSVSPVRDDAGAPLYMLAQMQDVTERKQAEAALRASTERHELVLEATNDLIYDWDVASGALYFSAVLQSIYGHECSGVDVNIAWWVEHIHPDDRGAVRDSLEAALLGDAGQWTGEYRFRRGDGAYAAVLDRGRIVRDGRGTAVRMIGSMSDLTDRRQLEAQLRESQKMEAVGRLAGGVAHDFNNLLTAILGYADLASAEGGASEEIAEIQKAAQRATLLTRQLLAFGRRQIRRPERVDVNAVVRDTDRLLSQLLGGHIQLVTQPGPGTAVVEVDPSQLDQILVNLAVNARDAMPDGGTVHVATSVTSLPARDGEGGHAAGEFVRLVVADTGAGIAADVLPHVFEPFFSTKGEAGNGLGLSTVYGIVRQNGGRIDVQTAPGAGTRFLVYLPLAAREERPAPAPAAAPPAGATAGAGAGATVLLAEDEAPVRALARRILQRAGYRVLEARHGADALLLWRRHRHAVDVVVTDLVMPEMGGVALVDALHRERPALPVLFMSGYTDDEVARRGFSDARTAFLPKPFTAEGLVAAVADALARAPSTAPSTAPGDATADATADARAADAAAAGGE